MDEKTDPGRNIADAFGHLPFVAFHRRAGEHKPLHSEKHNAMELSEALNNASELIAQALGTVFISTNEADSNLEPANMVDAIAQAGRAIGGLSNAIDEASNRIAEALYSIADAIQGAG